jgi:hypothetical protein
VSAGGDIIQTNKNSRFVDNLQFIKEITTHFGIIRNHIPGDRGRQLDYEWFNHDLAAKIASFLCSFSPLSLSS